ncbi:MAG: hypothetical protein MRJ65_12950 [Candidatus Brocadiaceae bacterium]|nr:hypothetical protein [Candidatus Brocadiaceae bacterium]
MIVERFLYSRTLTVDYRWIVQSGLLSLEENQILERFFDFFKKYRLGYAKAGIKPLFCINFSKATVLFTLQSGLYKDEFGRDIFSLEGICASHAQKRVLWKNMPLIIDTYIGALNIWAHIGFQKADSFVKNPSELYTLDTLPPDNETQNIEGGKVPSEAPDFSRAVILPFTSIGLKKLKALINSSAFRHADFAFGCTEEMVREENFRILAYVNDKRRKETQGKPVKGKKHAVIGSGKKHVKVSQQDAYENEKVLAFEGFNPILRNSGGKKQKYSEKKVVFSEQKWKEIIQKLKCLFMKK